MSKVANYSWSSNKEGNNRTIGLKVSYSNSVSAHFTRFIRDFYLMLPEEGFGNSNRVCHQLLNTAGVGK